MYQKEKPKIQWGPLLRSFRKSRNLRQAEIAAVLHITRQGYSKIETGKCRPSAEQIAILSHIYDVDLNHYVIRSLPETYVAEQDAIRSYLNGSVPSELSF